ncbi:acyltransferase [Kitasatospora sp. RB6PN24]|uniref:acyltransferase family protein n=1 Tax=Kitasatospora humi TaxID=2893891 RepID=UPI001E31FF45|nr:acyltransferase [Kitasatospora humi]MCC9310544.1 acyltransferase [Kitasatospora humi]
MAHTPTVTAPERPAAEDSERDPAAAKARVKRPRLYVLDGMRLVAALGVVLWHWAGVQTFTGVWNGQTAKLLPLLHKPAQYGWVGVELFFLISGFVICMSCWGKSVGDFAASRVARLFPAYWFSVLLTSAVLYFSHTIWGANTQHPTPSRVLSNLTMLNDPLNVDPIDPVYWTLWAELRFYIMFGLLMATGLTYRKVVAFCGLWMVAAAITPKANMPILETLFQATYSWYFIAGVLMYLIYRFGPNLMLFGMIGICWMMAQERIKWVIDANHYATWKHMSWTVVFGLITIAFVAVLGAALGWFNRIQWKWLSVAGALTYPVYLIHQEIGFELIHKLRHHSFTPYAALCTALVVMLIAAWLVHRLVERPLAPLLTNAMKKSFDQVRQAAEPRRS